MRRVPFLLSPLIALGAIACGGSGPSFCELATEFQAAAPSDEGDLEARMSEALGVLDELVDAAPEEIVDEARALRDGVEDFVTQGESPGPGLPAASAEMSDYIARECGPTEPT